MIEVNEYITSFKDIKTHLDFAICGTLIDRLEIVNDGCSVSILNNIKRYVNQYNVKCIIINKKVV